MKNRRRRRRTGHRRRNKGILALCGFIELLAVAALVLIVGWNLGIGDWMRELNRPVVQELDLSGIHSQYGVLMQAKGGKVLGTVNGEERMYPASLTKMMTVIVALEELGNLKQEITLTDEIFAGLYEQDATQAGFQAGEQVTVKDLLYGAMLPSGAECCRALAVAAAGSEEAFVERMNQKADKIGMENSHFQNTTGLHGEEHYSTALDMAILLKYSLRNKDFREIIQSPVHSTAGTNLHPDGITFYSSMFRHLPDAEVAGGKILGGKTGYTGDAGYCLASFSEIDGREYILVTAGAPETNQHIQDAVTIYNRLGEAALALGD